MIPAVQVFGVRGFGFQGSVWGLGSADWALEVGVWSLGRGGVGCGGLGLGFGVWGSGFRGLNRRQRKGAAQGRASPRENNQFFTTV